MLLPLSASVYVLFGGAIGAWLRMLVISFFAGVVPGTPLGMALVNILGSFMIGLVYQPLSNIHLLWLKYCVIGGILGGLTTFSTYALDVYLLLQDKKFAQAAGFGIVVPVLAIVAVCAGHSVYRRYG